MKCRQVKLTPAADDPAFALKVTNVPPREGPLAPCGSGWYLGSGNPGERLFPGLTAGRHRAGRVALVGLVGGSFLNVGGMWERRPPSA